MTIDELRKKLDETSYVYDDNMLTILYVALTLGRPLLIEGAAGVGKTEVAKVMAQALGRDLVRLQCYDAAHERHEHVGVQPEELLHGRAARCGQFDDDQATTRLQHTQHFAQPAV